MNKFKPYTIGLCFSILFHIPFVYLYLNEVKVDLQPDILLDPILVHCSISTEKSLSYTPLLRPPSMSTPPRDF